MPDWFEQNAPKQETGSGDWFAKNAPKPETAPTPGAEHLPGGAPPGVPKPPLPEGLRGPEDYSIGGSGNEPGLPAIVVSGLRQLGRSIPAFSNSAARGTSDLIRGAGKVASPLLIPGIAAAPAGAGLAMAGSYGGAKLARMGADAAGLNPDQAGLVEDIGGWAGGGIGASPKTSAFIKGAAKASPAAVASNIHAPLTIQNLLTSKIPVPAAIGAALGHFVGHPVAGGVIGAGAGAIPAIAGGGMDAAAGASWMPRVTPNEAITQSALPPSGTFGRGLQPGFRDAARSVHTDPVNMNEVSGTTPPFAGPFTRELPEPVSLKRSDVLPVWSGIRNTPSRSLPDMEPVRASLPSGRQAGSAQSAAGMHQPETLPGATAASPGSSARFTPGQYDAPAARPLQFRNSARPEGIRPPAAAGNGIAASPEMADLLQRSIERVNAAKADRMAAEGAGSNGTSPRVDKVRRRK